ncbi:MAG TPA: 2-hydroxychromene-2-carboxylate isomerase [Dokdonella sp.]|jgi:2-hydroxychromene-2-carboxylate isomerase|nr:2-hydroxychromene-2-carboxylate isomerase [Dokdonella sp.]
MQTVWYFDFISPFAYLQLARIRALGEKYPVTPRPIVLAALLRHHGQLGPAEIPGKREFTYRLVQWSAAANGMALRFPPAHPFNPLCALRLAIACGSRWDAIAAIFEHVWKHGRAADSAAALEGVARSLGIADVDEAISAAAVKEQLRANTEEAVARGVFGVPTLRLGDQLFWGNDATPMFEAALADPEIFSRGEYARVSQLPSAVERRR